MGRWHALSTFNFNDTSAIRVVTLKGDPWFVGNDACVVLGISHFGNAYSRLDPDEVIKVPRADIGMRQGKKAVLISESGLYKLIMRSDKPQAKPFQDWVTKVVLPAIRKDGGRGPWVIDQVDNRMTALRLRWESPPMTGLSAASMVERKVGPW